MQCELCNFKVAYHRAASFNINYLCIRHKQKTAGTDLGHYPAVLVCSVGMPPEHRLATMKMSTVTVNVSFLQGDGIPMVMLFVEPEYNGPSQQVVVVHVIF